MSRCFHCILSLSLSHLQLVLNLSLSFSLMYNYLPTITLSLSLSLSHSLSLTATYLLSLSHFHLVLVSISLSLSHLQLLTYSLSPSNTLSSFHHSSEKNILVQKYNFLLSSYFPPKMLFRDSRATELFSRRRSLWPDVGEKSSQIYSKSCPNSIQISLT